LNENLGEIDAGQNLKRLSRHARGDTADCVEQVLYVPLCRPEVDDASTQSEPTIDRGVR
jgi:hypothetical protein